MAGLLDAEKDDDDHDDNIILPADLEAEARKQLADPRHLSIFITWYSFGGVRRGISPQEAATMPETMRRDFVFLLSELGKLRRRRERLDAAQKENKPS